MPIFKGTITNVVMFEAEDLKTAEKMLLNLTAADIEFNTDCGEWIGNEGLESIVEVPPDKVEAELLELGNDGTFFNPEEDE